MKKFINTLLVLSFVLAYPFTIYALDETEEEASTEVATNENVKETNEENTNLEQQEETDTIGETPNENEVLTKNEKNKNDNEEKNTDNEEKNTDSEEKNTDNEEKNTDSEEKNTDSESDNTSSVDSNGSRWTASQPERLLTSNKIVDSHNVEYEAAWYYFEGKVTLTVTIPEDYEEDKIVIAPDVFEKLAFKVYGDIYDYETENVIFGAVFQAGDKIDLDIVINNLSKYTYNYDKTSFEIFPKEDIVYIEVDENVQDKKAPLFNGTTVNDKYHFSRMYNTALRVLLPNSNQLAITDDAIDAALKEKGYENGIDDYDNYLLDFYNNKYGTNYSNLDNFPDGVIREILGETDPYMHLNSAYSSVGITYIQTTGRWADTPETILNQINNKTGKNYNTIEEFVVEYYNGVYGTNATKLVELSAEALDEFFSSQGMERGGRYLLETNPEVLALSYNYFYNKSLGFVFEDDKKDKEWYDLYNESENYSIGEYMRDVSKGDEHIIAAAGSLAPSSTNSIKNMTLFTSGNYVLNAYINYEFMVDLQFSYSAPKGNVIAKYVDIDTLEEIESREETSGMVGKDYSTFKKDITDYEYVTVEGEENGTYIDGTIYITYYYTKNIGDEGPKDDDGPKDDEGPKDDDVITPPHTDATEIFVEQLVYIDDRKYKNRKDF